jgi:hypothetical protein
LASLPLAVPRTKPDDQRVGQSVQDEAASLGATPDDFGRAPFAMMDILRRSLGNALGAFGLDPDECPYRIVSLGPHWRLRDYGGHDTSLSLLIVAAPIKRAYIWDLAPSVSAVRYCMREGLHVHLLEWMPVSQRNQNNGLDEYAEAISVSPRFRAEAQRPRRSSLVTRLVARSRQFSPPGHLQAFAVSYFSEHRLSLQRVDSGTSSSP